MTTIIDDGNPVWLEIHIGNIGILTLPEKPSIKVGRRKCKIVNASAGIIEVPRNLKPGMYNLAISFKDIKYVMPLKVIPKAEV